MYVSHARDFNQSAFNVAKYIEKFRQSAHIKEHRVQRSKRTGAHSTAGQSLSVWWYKHFSYILIDCHPTT